MYTIKHGNRVLFDPSTPGYQIEAPILSMEANKICSMDFTIYPDNPEFSQIATKTSVLSVYRDGTLMMRLRPMYKKLTFAGGVSYKCEEQAAMLDDVLHRPDYFNGTVQAYMQRMVNAYNALVDSASAVTLGNVLFNATTEDTFINDDYEGFWEGLVSHLVDVYGGYLLPRYTTSGLYIDYVSDADLPAGGQTITFGENMADLFLETEGSETYTVLIPLGPNVDVDNPQEGQAKQRPMTIASVNSGLDYLENAAGIALYGRREKTQQWQSAENPTDLMAKGATYLAEHAAQLKQTITLSVVDLHYLNVNTAAIQWMTRIPIVSNPHSVSAQYTATKIDLNLGSPEPIQLQLGEPSEVFTDRVPKNSVSRRRGGAGGRGGGRAASSSDVEHWEMVVRKENDILWDSGVKEIHESGIILDAQSGVRLYNFKDIILGNSQAAGLKGYIDVNAEKVGLVVEGTGAAAHIKAAQIVASINAQTGQSAVLISADKITLDGQTTIDSLLTGQSAIGNLLVTDAKVNHLRIPQYGTIIMDANTGFSYGGESVSWQNTTVVTGVTITDATVGLSTKRYFLYTDSSTNRTPTGVENAYVVTSRTNGSHTVTTKVLHYLGKAATDS